MEKNMPWWQIEKFPEEEQRQVIIYLLEEWMRKAQAVREEQPNPFVDGELMNTEAVYSRIIKYLKEG